MVVRGLRQLEAEAARDHRVGVVVAGLDGGRGGDELERRPGRQRGADGPVDERLARVGAELLVQVGDGTEVVGGELVGVEGGCRRHREHPSRGGLEGHHRALRVTGQGLEARPRGVLRGRVDRELDVAARRVGVAEQVDEAGDEQSRVVAGQHRVLRALHPGLAVPGEVAGERGVLERLGVGALELVLVVGGHALRDRVLADEDRPALAGERRGDDAAVARVLRERVGADVHQVGGVDQERHEEHQAEHRDDADGLVHRSFTTWVLSLSLVESSTGSMRGAGRRAWSEMRSRRATMTQFATSEEPP